jgi:hypothetical protein
VFFQNATEKSRISPSHLFFLVNVRGLISAIKARGPPQSQVFLWEDIIDGGATKGTD